MQFKFMLYLLQMLLEYLFITYNIGLDCYLGCIGYTQFGSRADMSYL